MNLTIAKYALKILIFVIRTSFNLVETFSLTYKTTSDKVFNAGLKFLIFNGLCGCPEKKTH